jgi:hypothetical protein
MNTSSPSASSMLPTARIEPHNPCQHMLRLRRISFSGFVVIGPDSAGSASAVANPQFLRLSPPVVVATSELVQRIDAPSVIR